MATRTKSERSAAVHEVLDALRTMGSERNRAGMSRFGITTDRAFGVSVTALRAFARGIGRDQQLAEDLWRTGWHEAQMLATIIGDHRQVTRATAEAWVRDFDSWDVCDGACNNLFRRTPFAHELVEDWVHRDEEFVRRAGFAMIAVLATHDKTADDAVFAGWLEHVAAAADDGRNFVKKAVSWALREIGGRSPLLRTEAERCARALAARTEASARWIGRDALREFARKPLPSS